MSPESLNSYFFSYCQNERRHTALSAHYPQGLVSPVFLDETEDVCVCVHVCIYLLVYSVHVSATVMTFTPRAAVMETMSLPKRGFRHLIFDPRGNIKVSGGTLQKSVFYQVLFVLLNPPKILSFLKRVKKIFPSAVGLILCVLIAHFKSFVKSSMICLDSTTTALFNLF